MPIDRTIQIVQMAYPQVYLACHTRHQRKRTNAHRLSERDSSILAHLSQRYPIMPARLAAHLGISRSTASEALKRLVQHGFAGKTTRATAQGRRTGIVLTEKGAHAIAETSVLEERRLRGVLGTLTPAEQKAVERGLSVLARASREWAATQPRDNSQGGMQ